MSFGLALRFARWSGTSWAPVGSGLDAAVVEIAEDISGDVLAYTPNLGRIRVFDGTSWSANVPTFGMPLSLAKMPDGSVAALGAHRVVFLGYTDSGMTGWDQNSDPDCFFQAELADAAERLAVILREENADVLTAYDWHGNYGHPDHIKVHEVGHAAVDLLISEGRGIRLFEATMNRDRVVTMMQQAMEMGVTMNLLDVTLMEKQVVGSLFGSGNPRADIPKLAGLYREGQLDLDGLVTRTYSLDGVNDGYEAMRAGENIRGVLVYE